MLAVIGILLYLILGGITSHFGKQYETPKGSPVKKTPITKNQESYWKQQYERAKAKLKAVKGRLVGSDEPGDRGPNNDGMAQNYTEVEYLRKMGPPKKWTNYQVKQFRRGAFEGLNDEEFYLDPTGAIIKTGLNLTEFMHNKIEPALMAFDESQHEGDSFEQSLDIYRTQVKALASTAWNIPVHAIQGVPFSIARNLPASQLIARRANSSTTIQTNPLTSLGASEHFNEGAATYPSNDDQYNEGTISDYTFTVDSYARQNQISDQMMMVGGVYDNPAGTTALAQTQAQREYEESQILLGTGGGDANGFDGLTDLVRAAQRTNKTAGITYPDDFEDLTDQMESLGGDLDTTFIFTDRFTFGKLKRASGDYVRYEVMGNKLNFSFRAMDVAGVPVLTSKPMTALASGSRKVLAVDYGRWWMDMLQDATMKDIAKTGPNTDFATDSYGCLVGNARPFIVEWYNVN